jgi:hypothetical protein
MKSMAIMVNLELNFIGSLDLPRFMIPIKYLHSKLTADEIWFIAERIDCGKVEVDGNGDVEEKFRIISFA